MRAAVTGSNGFIGSHLVDALADAGHTPVALLREGSADANLAHREVERRHVGLDDAAALAEAFDGIDVVFHVAGRTAAYDEDELIRTNGGGTARVLGAARDAGVRRVVLVSSLEAMGQSHHDTPRAEHHAPAPFTRYGRSKFAGEHEAWRAVQDGHPAEVVVVRPPLVYGPRDLDVLQMIQSSNWRIVARPGFRDGWISAVHAEDLVALLLAAAERGRPLPRGPKRHALAGDGLPYDVPAAPEHRDLGEGIYFAEDGGRHTIASFGHEAARALGKSAFTLSVPPPIAWAAGWANEAFFKLIGKPCPAYNTDKVAASFAEGWWCDASKAGDELGWTPRRPLPDGLAHTVAWLRDRGVL